MINPIIDEFNSLREKDKQNKKSIRSIFTNLKSDLNSLLKQIDVETSEDKQSKLETSIKKIVDENAYSKQFNTISNNYYNQLTKFGKVMSSSLEVENQIIPKINSYDKNLFYTVIAKDLYRRGNFKTADSLLEESGVQFNQNFRFIFNDLNIISCDLRNRKLESLIKWCKKHEKNLMQMKSKLQFETLKLYVTVYFT